jgi:hypothetical protein
MDHPMLAFAISAAVVLTTETSYGPQKGDAARKAVPVGAAARARRDAQGAAAARAVARSGDPEA